MIILECSHFALYALDIYIFSVFNIWVVFFSGFRFYYQKQE